jgi:hypothetical protein
MPKKLTTPEEIAAAWERKRERDRVAQAKWVSEHKEEHLERMKQQYQKKKAEKEESKKPEEPVKTAEPKPKTRKIRTKPLDNAERVRKYKLDNPKATNGQIAKALNIQLNDVKASFNLLV